MCNRADLTTHLIGVGGDGRIGRRSIGEVEAGHVVAAPRASDDLHDEVVFDRQRTTHPPVPIAERTDHGQARLRLVSIDQPGVEHLGDDDIADATYNPEQGRLMAASELADVDCREERDEALLPFHRDHSLRPRHSPR